MVHLILKKFTSDDVQTLVETLRQDPKSQTARHMDAECIDDGDYQSLPLLEQQKRDSSIRHREHLAKLEVLSKLIPEEIGWLKERNLTEVLQHYQTFEAMTEEGAIIRFKFHDRNLAMLFKLTFADIENVVH